MLNGEGETHADWIGQVLPSYMINLRRRLAWRRKVRFSYSYIGGAVHSLKLISHLCPQQSA